MLTNIHNFILYATTETLNGYIWEPLKPSLFLFFFLTRRTSHHYSDKTLERRPDVKKGGMEAISLQEKP